MIPEERMTAEARRAVVDGIRSLQEAIEVLERAKLWMTSKADLRAADQLILSFHASIERHQARLVMNRIDSMIAEMVRAKFERQRRHQEAVRQVRVALRLLLAANAKRDTTRTARAIHILATAFRERSL